MTTVSGTMHITAFRARVCTVYREDNACLSFATREVTCIGSQKRIKRSCHQSASLLHWHIELMQRAQPARLIAGLLFSLLKYTVRAQC